MSSDCLQDRLCLAYNSSYTGRRWDDGQRRDISLAVVVGGMLVGRVLFNFSQPLENAIKANTGDTAATYRPIDRPAHSLRIHACEAAEIAPAADRTFAIAADLAGCQVSGRLSRQHAYGISHLSLPTIHALVKIQSHVSDGIQVARGVAYSGTQALPGLPRVRLVRTQSCLYPIEANASIRPKCQDARRDKGAEIIR